MMILQNLPQIRGEYRANYKLAPLTWFKVGGPAEVLFKPLDLQDLTHFLTNVSQDIAITVLGAGSNIIVRDGGVEGVVIKLGRNFAGIDILPGNQLRIGASALNYNIAQVAMQNGITGFEFLVGIPGTVGGGIAMNAGAYGREYKDIATSIEAVDMKGVIHVIDSKDSGFGYRSNNLPKDLIFTSIICDYELGDRLQIKGRMDEIMKLRESSQPIKEKTGGSTFANPTGYKAWQLIDQVGMRGARRGDAMISDLHCNFMINCGNATASDLEGLGEEALDKVRAMVGVELKWEIKRVGINFEHPQDKPVLT
jgi:UDP-N-acetylmuramate dehydrogenase